MKAISRRVQRLERTRGQDANQKPFRVILSNVGKKLNLETSSVQIIQHAGGGSTEIVTLDGCLGDITDEELDRFVAGRSGAATPRTAAG
jgi:hypothetical protein